MKHPLVLAAVALLVAAIGCSPDLVPATASCTRIADCPLGKICDKVAGQCIPEPTARFLGRFTGRVPGATKDPALQLSEVLGNTTASTVTRFAMTSTTVDAVEDRLVVRLSDPQAEEVLEIVLPSGASGRVSLGRAIRDGLQTFPPFAVVYNRTRFTREGSSLDGYLELSTPLVADAAFEAYLDVTVTPPPAGVRAKLGEPCPNGLADCGSAVASVGGASLCYLDPRNTNQTPVCSRGCTSNADCTLGSGVCNNGICTRRCEADADCADIGRVCYAAANASEAPGCGDPL